MKDFNSYTGGDNKQSDPDGMADMAKMMAKAFEGKGEADILRAIYKEAERGRKAGTLTDSDLARFRQAQKARTGDQQTQKNVTFLFACGAPFRSEGRPAVLPPKCRRGRERLYVAREIKIVPRSPAQPLKTSALRRGS